jgi:hypothetical protein
MQSVVSVEGNPHIPENIEGREMMQGAKNCLI